MEKNIDAKIKFAEDLIGRPLGPHEKKLFVSFTECYEKNIRLTIVPARGNGKHHASMIAQLACYANMYIRGEIFDMKLECCKCTASAKIESFSRDKRFIGVVKCLNPECDNVFVGPIMDSLCKATDNIENKAVESGLFRKEYTTYDSYWEKAEFQDEWSHRQHVENYKKGIHSSIAFDEQYMKEAQEELEREKKEYVR